MRPIGHPERFVRGRPPLPVGPPAVWINPPAYVASASPQDVPTDRNLSHGGVTRSDVSANAWETSAHPALG